MPDKQMHPFYAGIHQWCFNVVKASLLLLLLHINISFQCLPISCKICDSQAPKTKHIFCSTSTLTIFCRRYQRTLNFLQTFTREQRRNGHFKQGMQWWLKGVREYDLCSMKSPWPPGKGGSFLTIKPLACTFLLLKHLPHSVGFLFHICAFSTKMEVLIEPRHLIISEIGNSHSVSDT